MKKTNITHTPSPWTIGRSYSSTHATAIRWQGENLAWVCGTDSAHEFSPEQTAANARLIAAAPDLLAALEKATARILELVGICEINGLANSFAKADWTAEFFAVISEAKGGQL